ncbi:MAG: RDD family protein [Chitinophagaceae bacterium]|nr:RDD family protein [Chitinophagaceae bacterium]
MAIIRIPTNFNIEIEFEIPEFYRRFFALLIDLLVLYVYLLIAGALLQNIFSGHTVYSDDDYYNYSFIRLIFMVPVFAYHLVCEITMRGQSIGKKIMGIRVVSETGSKPTISQFIIRWLLRVSDYAVILIIFLYASYGPGVFIFIPSLRWFTLLALAFLGTDTILVISSKKGQRLGDILAKTILIHTSAKGSINETVFMNVEENYVPSFPQIMNLSDKDINSIKSILETSRKRGDYRIAEAASEKIKNHLHINSSMSPFDFLEVLLKDYNYLSVK